MRKILQPTKKVCASRRKFVPTKQLGTRLGLNGDVCSTAHQKLIEYWLIKVRIYNEGPL